MPMPFRIRLLPSVLFLCLLSMAVFLGDGCGSKTSTANTTPAAKPPVDVAAVRAKAEAGDPKAQAQLGRLYATGQGVTNDFKEAVKWYQLAADKNHADGQFGLGELYDAGQGVHRDVQKAAQLYRMAAEQGHAGAQYTLGFLYEGGYGIPKDQKESAKWTKLAADQGEPLAEFAMAQRCERGLGVNEDRAEAFKWYSLALSHDIFGADKGLKNLKSKMSSAEVAEGKKRLAAFSPSSPPAPAK